MCKPTAATNTVYLNAFFIVFVSFVRNLTLKAAPGYSVLHRRFAIHSTHKRTLEMNDKIQFLGQHPNGSFFITKDAQKIAQAVADEDGFRYWEFKQKNTTTTLAEIVAGEAKGTPPVDVEVRRIVVAGEDVLVTTLTASAKEKKKKAAAAAETKKDRDDKKFQDKKDREKENRQNVDRAAKDKKKVADGEAQAEVDAAANLKS